MCFLGKLLSLKHLQYDTRNEEAMVYITPFRIQTIEIKRSVSVIPSRSKLGRVRPEYDSSE